MEWLCWLIGGLAIAVVLGHFGWVLVARIFGYQVKTLRAGKAAGRPCPRCRSAALTPQGMCMLCGYSNRAPALPTIDSEGFSRTAAYLTRLLNAGLIDADTHAKVQSAIRAEQKRTRMQGLMGGPAQARSPHLPPPLPPLPAIPETDDSAEDLVFDERGALVPRSVLEGSPVVPEHPEPVAPVEPPPIPATIPPPETVAAPPFVAPPPRPLPPPRRVPPAAPPKPRRPLSEVFAAFMEENNIRWGELVGGLLIVGCSVALVLSFWGQIHALPWLQFSVFTAVTAGLFGLGLYTEHRWKLPTTSRGILLIATLLVPLNFLAFAAFSKGQPPGALTLGAELVAFALFGWLVWQAGKVIAPFWPEILTAGVCGLSASLLAMRYANGATQLSAAQLYGFALLPVGCYGVLSAWMLRRARQWKTIHAPGAIAILLLLGVLSFGTILALGLLVAQAQDHFAALRRLAPLVSLAGVPALASGLLIWRRVTGAPLAKLRTTGTAVAIAGAGILLAGIALAWPDPAAMLPVAACDFIVLTALALLYDIPAAHALAVPCLLLAWLLGFHVARGHVQWVTTDARPTLDALLNPIGGTALVPLVLLLAGAREWFIRRGHVAHAYVYGIVVICCAALSVAMVTWGGFARIGDPLGATWVYLVYAALAFVLTWKTNRIEAAWTGWGMLLAGLVQGFVAHRLTNSPWSDALLTAAAIATVTNAFSVWLGERGARLLRETSRPVAITAAGAAVAVALAGITYSNAGRVSVTVFIAAAIAFAIAFIEAIPALFVAAQALLAGGLVLAVTARLTGQPWFLESSAPLLEPWTIQAQAVALALFCLAWTIFRLVLKSGAVKAGPSGGAAQDGNDAGKPSIRNRLVRLADSPWPLDRGLSAVLLLALLGLALAGVGPAIVAELSRAAGVNTQVGLDSQASRAIGAGSWWLLATLITVFAGAWLEALRLHSTVGSASAKPQLGARSVNRTGVAFAVLALLVTLWAACPLLAAREAGMGASAAAMRWLAAFFILLGSVPLWLRERLPRSLGLTGNEGDGADRGFTQLVRGTLDVLGILPVLVLTAYPAVAALSGEPIAGPSAVSFFARIGPSLSYAIPLLVIALVLVGNAIRERSPGHAFAASLVLCFTTTLAYLLSLTTSHEPLSMVRLFQINSLTMSGFALAWLAARMVASALGGDPGRIPVPLKVQVRIGLGLSMLVVFAAGLLVVLS
ncbi:MAG: hypothetical protein JWL69_5211, partial [Phycisphaerales bacterium]|nr:hypothetical protein [Phycisphaerales bacterium]